MKLLKWNFLILVVCMLTACSVDIESVVRKLVPEEAMVVSDRAVEYYLTQDSEGLRKLGDQGLKEQATDEALNHLYSFIGEGDVLSKNVIGGSFNASTNSGTIAEASYEIEFSDRYLTIGVRLVKIEGEFRLNSFTVNVLDDSYSEQLAFSLGGKSPIHYLILALTIFVPIFILGTLVACIRRRGMKRRILWTIFIIFGVSSITFNWTTGNITYSVLQFQLFGAGFELAEAWYFTVGLPLGAISWWFKHGLKSGEAAGS